MFVAALAVFFLQVATPADPGAVETPAVEEVAAAAPTAVVIPAGMMDCDYDRQSRLRMCTTADGEILRCRRERTLGSRFRTWVCFTYAEDQQIQLDSQQALDRAQHIATPGGG